MSTELILLRHGESEANLRGLFTGALDVPLTAAGMEQSHRAAESIEGHLLNPAVIISSPLTRARETARIVVAHLRTPEVRLDWRLIERSYGALTGRSRSEVIAAYGEATVRQWRRSRDQAPPPMPDEQLARLRAQPALSQGPPELVRATESLSDAIDRLRPFLTTALVPQLRSGKSVLVVAHGNSLRALVTTIEHLEDIALERLNIPAAEPLVYTVDGAGWPVPGSGSYLNPLSAATAAAILTREGGT